MHPIKYIFIICVLSKNYFGNPYLVFKDEISKSKFQKNMGTEKSITKIEILIYFFCNNRKEEMIETIDSVLVNVVKTNRNTFLITHRVSYYYKNYNRKDVFLRPFIRYYNTIDEKTFCEKIYDINKLNSKASPRDDKITREDERLGYIKKLLFDSLYSYCQIPIDEDYLVTQLKKVGAKEMYRPVFFTKPLHMMRLWIYMSYEAKRWDSFKDYFKKGIYILQLHYVTSIYEGGTFTDRPDEILKSILKDAVKTDIMMDTILGILNDFELTRRALLTDQKIEQKSCFLLDCDIVAQTEGKPFYCFVISNEQISTEEETINNVKLFSSGKKKLIPKFYFTKKAVFIPKEDLDRKDIDKIKIEFKIENGMLKRIESRVIRFERYIILEDLY